MKPRIKFDCDDTSLALWEDRGTSWPTLGTDHTFPRCRRWRLKLVCPGFSFEFAADVDRFERFVVAYILLDHLREPARVPRVSRAGPFFSSGDRAECRAGAAVWPTPPSQSRANYSTPRRPIQSMPSAPSHLVN